MSATPTLILHPRFDEDSQLLWQTAVTRGWQVIRSQSFSTGELDRGGNGLIAVYGGYMWAETIADELDVKLLSPPDDWLLTLPEQFVRRKVWLSTVGEIRQGQFPVFVKSLRGKTLASRVYHSVADLPDVGDEVEVIAQEPVTWNFEYRCFVTWRGIETFSRYATFGELDVRPVDGEPSTCAEAGVVETVNQLLTQWGPEIGNVPSWSAAAVIDVGYVIGSEGVRGMAVVEANPAWCSGIYGCDPSKVLDVVAASCVMKSVQALVS